jgi:hypothetical protein
MDIVKVNCPVCGLNELPPHAFTPVVYTNAPDRSYYTFECISCKDLVVKATKPSVVRDLLSVYVIPEYVTIPEEALEERPATPIRNDELLDFFLGLNDLEDHLEELQSP